MTDLRKKSGLLYLAVFLLVVCAAAAGIMTVTAVLTEKPIRDRQQLAIREALRQVLPHFETVTSEETASGDGTASSVYTARDAGNRIIGYAVRTRTLQGYGGEVEALTGFDRDGKILRIIVTRHNETPGLGSQVMDRKVRRHLKDLFRKKEARDDGLPPNAALDSYIGKSVWKKRDDGKGRLSFITGASKKQGAPRAIRREEVHFVSGATVSSLAMLDLVNRAGAVLRGKMTGVPEK